MCGQNHITIHERRNQKLGLVSFDNNNLYKYTRNDYEVTIDIDRKAKKQYSLWGDARME